MNHVSHLTPLRVRLFTGSLAPRAREVLRHLLECARCRDLVSSLGQECQDTAALGHPAVPYSTILLRLEERIAALAPAVAAERDAAEPLLAELVGQPAERWRDLVESRAAFRTFAFASRLVEESYARSAQDPRAAEALARLALTISGSLDAGSYGETALFELGAQAWSLVGHALAQRQRWRRAEQAFRFAEELLPAPDSLAAAALCRLLANLRRAQRRYIEALALNARAASLFEQAGDHRGEKTAEEQQGELYLTLGEMDQALSHIVRAYLLMEPGLDAAAAHRGRLSLALCLLDLDRFSEAGELLEELSATEMEVPPPLRLQVRLVRARAAVGLGRASAAEELLTALHREAESQGLLDEAWLVTLDLAGLFLRHGQIADLTTLLTRMKRFERALAKGPREAISRLREAARREEATQAHLAEVHEALTRSHCRGARDDLLVSLLRQHRIFFREDETRSVPYESRGFLD